MKAARSFASDNNAGVHGAVLKAIASANRGHVVGYGDDAYTASATAKFRETFGQDVEVFLVFNGTAANVLGLSALIRSYEAVVCTQVAHIYNDECAAPEKFAGSKLIPLDAPSGTLTIDLVNSACRGLGDQHHAQPKVISITQATEMGTVYQPEQLKALTRFAHDHKMFMHMDGARLANAAVSLDQTLREASGDLGIDALSFGGTKNGLMGGEAVIFFNRELAENFMFIRKQSMQLASKMRFIAAQFEALLSNNLWRKSARHANRMAKLLEREVSKISRVEIVYPVETNAVFARLPRHAIARLQKRFFFYVWDEQRSVVRWMCSFDTTERDIREFTRFIAEIVRK